MHYFVWNVNPEIFRIGVLQVRYYGILFALVFIIGFYFFQKQMLRGGYPRKPVEAYFIWGIISVVLGTRLAHCFFYDPSYYLQHPLKILFIWEGGLASHGAAIGVPIGLYLYSKRYRFYPLDVMDRFALSACVGAAFVRIGNFINSEIVGRISYVPWAVRFPRYADHGAYPRHPSQLYEFAMAVVIFLILYFVDRRIKEHRPKGLMSALFLGLYFTARFIVEFFKEYQVSFERTYTMGQLLSIPFILIAIYMLLRIAINRNAFAAREIKNTQK